jgi:hypothetical protein
LPRATLKNATIKVCRRSRENDSIDFES